MTPQPDPSLTFINHASFLITTKRINLLIDPWVEGTSFDTGWSLLDDSTSNEQLYSALNNERRVIIWYSHEHSDHFSVSFLKHYPKHLKTKTIMLFQHTSDKRVVNFLKGSGFDAREQISGSRFFFDHDGWISTFSHESADSYCVIKTGAQVILNVNDCTIDTDEKAKRLWNSVQSQTNKVNFLFTQFGYANWEGNENDVPRRKKEALQILQNMRLQIIHVDPDVVVPFASFAYFSHPENFYMNDEQNRVDNVCETDILRPWKERFLILKPWDRISLFCPELITDQLNEDAIQHWVSKKTKIAVKETGGKSINRANLYEAWQKYRYNIAVTASILPILLQLVGWIKPLRVYLTDLSTSVILSYLDEIRFGDVRLDDCHMKCTSEVLNFLLSNEFGYHTIRINARYRTISLDAERYFSRFFVPQRLMKDGRGITHPIAMARYVIASLARKAEELRRERTPRRQI